MTIVRTRMPLTFVLATALFAAACGGGGGATATVAGIDGGGRTTTQGPIAGFGSVIVNGVRYDTNGATISIDGSAGSEDGLAAGRIVRVEGTVDAGGTTGRATRITYESAVRGPIDQIDVPNARLTVLGQTVLVTSDTIFAGSGAVPGIEAFSGGDLITVSGYENAAAAIVATRIDRYAGPVSLEVSGVISNVDTTQRRFRINGLTIDYATAVLDGFAGNAPVAGDRAFVKSAQALQGGVLAAATVSRRDAGVTAATGTTIDLEGLVTRFDSSSNFDVSGQRVQTTANTQFVAGTAQSVALDALLHVRGQRDAGGTLVATRIEFIPVSNVTIEAMLDGVDAGSGTLRLLGIDVLTTVRTRYDDDDNRIFTLRDLRIGDSVQVAGYVRDGRFVATRVSRDDDADGSDVEIDGPVTDLADPDFRIGSVAITTDDQTEFEIEGGSGSGAAGFFASAAGRTAEVEGRWNGVVVLAEEVELED